jgi:hypothetical protein
MPREVTVQPHWPEGRSGPLALLLQAFLPWGLGGPSEPMLFSLHNGFESSPFPVGGGHINKDHSLLVQALEHPLTTRYQAVLNPLHTWEK